MTTNLKSKTRALWLSGAAIGVMASLVAAPTASAIVPNDNQTPDDIVDTAGGVNGVGQYFRNDGFVCTGTLINPRTVLFAAHCVNDTPEAGFGPGGLRSAFSFDVNALPGFINWINNGFASNPDLFVYNVNQIQYNPDSLVDPNAFGFLEADIALATLDTPATDIPTWALLFSALPAPTSIDDVTGTGYHVNMTGYGRTGSGTTGASQGVDWRRKLAENYIGALTSFDDRNTFLFGAPFGNLPQNLYRTDFDDPNKTNPFDFNLYKDEPLPNEGTTAGGDSGGPLILDAANNDLANEDLVVGVLSGGSRFFGPQVFSSYGTESFYQPLYLFYNYIAASNPYRYASALEGDGAWEDATHWETTLDPAYRIINDAGEVVNGFPDEVEEGRLDTSPGWGEVCFDPEGANPGDGCQDLSSGDATPPAREAVAGVSNNVGELTDDELSRVRVELASDASGANTVDGEAATARSGGRLSGVDGALLGAEQQSHGGAMNGVEGAILGAESQSQDNGVEFAEEAPQNSSDDMDGAVRLADDDNGRLGSGIPLPAPTLANGLAGATDFVPDNIDPVVGSIDGRYFDVTLSAAGTTTLSSAVTIDKLTVNGAAAGLNVDSAGSLTSLIDVEQVMGTVNVDGSLESVGDYLLMQGILSGNGVVKTPFLTNVMGVISPGGTGTLGTLTIDGSAVLASASGLVIDVGATSGVTDVLQITGDSSLGGTVMINPLGPVQAGNVYRFLRTDGTQTGEFSGANNISAILKVALDHYEHSVIARIEAGSYQDAVNGNSPVQTSYATLLDDDRNTPGLAGLYAQLDLGSASEIQAILNSWAPVTETTTQSLAKATLRNVNRFHSNRMSALSNGDLGGTVTVMGSPIQMASNSDYMTTIADTAYLEANNEPRVRMSNSLPSDYAMYLSGSFINGSAAAMPTVQNFGDDEFDGWAITAGMEKLLSNNAVIGASVTYTQLEADGALNSTSESDHFAGTLYGQVRSESNMVLEGQVSVGSLGSQTSRTVTFPNTATLTSDDTSMTLSADIDASKEFHKDNFIFAPSIGLSTKVVDFDTVSEDGGVPALNIERDQFQSTQGRVGADIRTNAGAQAQIRVTADLVHEFHEGPGNVGANFVAAGVGGSQPFALYGTDKNWGEIGAGVRFNAGQAVIDLSVDTTVGRDDLDAQTYQAGVTFKF